MKYDRHHSIGAGNRHSPAPSIPVYSVCEICGEADESHEMMDGMCRKCVECLRRGLRQVQENSELDKPVRFYWTVAAVMAGVAVWIMWRWIR